MPTIPKKRTTRKKAAPKKSPFSLRHLSYDTYRAEPGVSHSELKDWITCPHYWKQKWVDKTLIQEPTDSLEFGKAVDCFIEDEGMFRDCYKRAEGRRSSLRQDGDPIVLTPAVYDRVLATAMAVASNATFKELTASASKQVSVFAEMSSGFHIKGRMDFLSISDSEIHIIDLKTAREAGWQQGFSRSFIQYGYFSQLAFYSILVRLSGMDRGPTSSGEVGPKKIRCSLAVVDKEKIRFYTVDEEVMKIATQVVMDSLNAFRDSKNLPQSIDPNVHVCPLELACPIQTQKMDVSVIGVNDVFIK